MLATKAGVAPTAAPTSQEARCRRARAARAAAAPAIAARLRSHMAVTSGIPRGTQDSSAG